MSLILELMKIIINQSFWTKNILILFNDHGMLGTQAWLDAYQQLNHSLIGEQQIHTIFMTSN